MTTRERSWLWLLLLLALVNGCYDTADEPQSGGHTNWLQCQALSDCAESQRAVDCKGGYCLDRSGARIAAEIGTTPVDAGGSARVDTGSSGGAAEPQHAVPDEWVEVQSICGYSFRAPPDVKQEPVQGEDSCVDRHLTADCQYDSGYGGFGTTYEEYRTYPEYSQEHREIDGLGATLYRARLEMPEDGRAYFAAIDFVPDSQKLYLTMYVHCRSAAGQDEAELVFGSIVRPRP